MGGGLMQLVAYGAQDVYLSGNPQITFFKHVYRRYTNFSIEAIEQVFNGNVDFGKKATVSISRHGDLISKIFLKLKFNSNYTLTSVLGVQDDFEDMEINLNPSKIVVNNLSFTTSNDDFTLSNSAGEFDAINFATRNVILISNSSVVENNGFFEIEEWVDNTRIKVRLPNTSNPEDDSTSSNNLTISAHEVNNNEWVRNFGYCFIKSVELQIGGTKIDKHYGEWMNIWNQLTKKSGHNKSYDMILNKNGSNELFIPLQFFCCEDLGLSLPLIALQYHDIRFDFEFNSLDECCSNSSTSTKIGSSSLLIDYIYLDSEERKKFAQSSHEYLIEQLQFTGIEVGNVGINKFRLNFNHPCKEIIWVVKKSGDNSSNKFINFTNNNNIEQGKNPVNRALLQLNGHDRFSEQSGKYFQNVQVLKHTSTPEYPGINVYSFALNPEEHQPSGTCNFSRIDNATLNMDLNINGNVYIFAKSYNVLRIMSGMGGLAYSN